MNNSRKNKFVTSFDKNKLIKLFDKNKFEIISLGYNCSIKKIIMEIFLIKTETNFFDYIGSTMWSINNLFENDFENLLDEENYKNIQIKTNVQANYLTNTQYYLRFFHDLTNITNKPTKLFFDKYLRRIDRLYNFLRQSKKIIFIRLEETNKDRIIYPEYADNFNTPEIEHLKKFSKIINNKFQNNNFLIIYLTKTFEDNYDPENNLLCVNFNKYDELNWKNCAILIRNVLLDKYDYIFNVLENI
jgi:hypothetical protein